MRRFQARPRHEAGKMNKLEARYANSFLEPTRLMSGEIQKWAFEAIKLRLADSTFYTPDFWVLTADGQGEFHEVKGFWESDARVKIKVAAEMFPEFRFVGITWDKRNGWITEEFGGREPQ